MTSADRPRLARILAVLGETFNEPVSDVRAEGYLIGLRDLPIEQVERGARCALQTCKFFPRPAEIRELAIGSPDMSAESAWLEILQEIRRIGSYGAPRLGPKAAEAMRCVWGSWKHLCETLPGEGPEFLGWAKRFKEAYGVVTHPSRLAIESGPHPQMIETRLDE